jgi:hypothetical protein
LFCSLVLQFCWRENIRDNKFWLVQWQPWESKPGNSAQSSLRCEE